MDRRNVLLGVVQDRSKTQTFTSSLLAKMNQQIQQQQGQHQLTTCEKSVQTHENVFNSNAMPATTLLINSSPHEAAEVANTLVSMANHGRQRVSNVKHVNVVSIATPPPQSALPIISLAEYTTQRGGVPTAYALANQASASPQQVLSTTTRLPTSLKTSRSSRTPNVHALKLTGGTNVAVAMENDNGVEYEERTGEQEREEQQEENNNDDSNTEDDSTMSTDEFQRQQTSPTSIQTVKGMPTKKSNKKKAKDLDPNEVIQYGPILVKPRKRVAPTLANGRKSKDEMLPPEEDTKRKLRRDRNKQAAAKCRQKRNELRSKLEKDEQYLLDQQHGLEHSIQTLQDQKNQLELLLRRHTCAKNRVSTTSTAPHVLTLSKSDYKSISRNPIDSNNNTNAASNNKRLTTISLTSTQDLFALSTPSSSSNSSFQQPNTTTSIPFLTIHIVPELAQALLSSTAVDKNKFAELLHPSSFTANTSTTSILQTTAAQNPSSSSLPMLSETTVTGTDANSM